METRLLVSLTFLLILVSSYCQDTTLVYFNERGKVTQWENKAVFVKRNIKRGSGDYIKEIAAIDGCVIERVGYSSRLMVTMDGRYQRFEECELSIEGDYRNGQRVGEWRKYDTSGLLKKISQWQNGKIDGLSRHLYPDGQLRAESRYDMGALFGVNRYWMPSGHLLAELRVDSMGIADFDSWYPNGQKMTEVRSASRLNWHVPELLADSIDPVEICKVLAPSAETESREFHPNGMVKNDFRPCHFESRSDSCRLVSWDATGNVFQEIILSRKGKNERRTVYPNGRSAIRSESIGNQTKWFVQDSLTNKWIQNYSIDYHNDPQYKASDEAKSELIDESTILELTSIEFVEEPVLLRGYAYIDKDGHMQMAYATGTSEETLTDLFLEKIKLATDWSPASLLGEDVGQWIQVRPGGY